MKTNSYLSIEKEVESDSFTYTGTSLVTTPGIWVDGKTYWVKNGFEKLITEAGISIHMKEEPIHSKIKFYEAYITNHNNQYMELKLLFKHHLQYATKEHFTFVAPTENVIFHVADPTIYLVNGQSNGYMMNQMTVQPFWNIHTNLIWSCEEKGSLKYQPMSKGVAVSVMAVDMKIPPKQTGKGHSWVIKGNSKKDLIQLNDAILKNTLAFPFKK